MKNNKKIFSTLAGVTVGALAGAGVLLKSGVVFADHQEGHEGKSVKAADKNCSGAKGCNGKSDDKNCNGKSAEHKGDKGCNADKSCSGDKGCESGKEGDAQD